MYQFSGENIQLETRNCHRNFFNSFVVMIDNDKLAFLRQWRWYVLMCVEACMRAWCMISETESHILLVTPRFPYYVSTSLQHLAADALTAQNNFAEMIIFLKR